VSLKRRFVACVSIATALVIGLSIATASAATTPVVTVTPNTGLVDGQTVTVTASGLTDTFVPLIYECERAFDLTSLDSVLVHCRFLVFEAVRLDNGTLAPTSVTVFAHVTFENGVVHDCLAQNDCVVMVGGLGIETSFRGAVAPITFGVHPRSKADCRHGGYRRFVDDGNRPFRNQGRCVAFVNHH
jgi:hypothetical protein